MKRNRLPFRLALIALAAWIPGCTDNAGPGSGSSGPVDFTEAVPLLAAHAASLAALDAERYIALLEAPSAGRDGGFRYYPTEQVLAEMSWIDGDSWSHEDESTMVRHLADPEYVDPYGASVASIVASFETGSEPAEAGGVIVMAGTLHATVTMTDDRTGTYEQPYSVELVRDGDGFLRIHALRELSPARATLSGWSTLKALFRAPAGVFPDPRTLVRVHAFALHQRNPHLYAATLASQFEFVPRSQDAGDIPWLSPQQPWDRAEELGMVGHMMDPGFVSDVTGGSVQSIEVNLVSTSEETTTEGNVDVTSSAEVMVLWSPTTGATCNAVLVFTAVPDGEGYRIGRIQEHSAFSVVDPVEEQSWGLIKLAYRLASGNTP